MGSAIKDVFAWGVRQSMKAASSLGGNDTSDAMKRMLDEQRSHQAQIQGDLMRQPKPVMNDDFLSQKQKQLRKMRLGLASTLKGTRLTAPSTPSLAASSPGKTNLGE